MRGLAGIGARRADAPQRGDLGEPELPLAREHSAADAAQRAGEVIGHHRGSVGPPIVVGVFDPADHLGFATQRGFALGAEPLADLGQTVFHGARGQVVFQHEHVMPDIEHTGAVSVGLAGEHPTLFIHREGHRIGQLGLRGPEPDRESRGHLELLDPLLALGGCRGQDGNRRAIILHERAETSGGRRARAGSRARGRDVGRECGRQQGQQPQTERSRPDGRTDRSAWHGPSMQSPARGAKIELGAGVSGGHRSGCGRGPG